MPAEQRVRAAQEIRRVADWCLQTAIAPDGTVVARAVGESLPNSYYFTLGITPMFLFSGIFFPFNRLPSWVEVVAWFTPLYHLVQVTRGLADGPGDNALHEPGYLLLASHGGRIRRGQGGEHGTDQLRLAPHRS